MLALFAATILAPTPYVFIRCDKPVVAKGEAPVFQIFISNKGRVPALVVQPNDGSDWHWRTPYTGWAMKPVSDKTAWPAEPPKATEPRCGNMNTLTDKELVDLVPGRSVELNQSWLFQKPKFDKPGKYKVVFYYWHVNSDPTSRMEIEPNSDTKVRDRVMSSEPYRLRSNEVVITVK